MNLPSSRGDGDGGWVQALRATTLRGLSAFRNGALGLTVLGRRQVETARLGVARLQVRMQDAA